MSDDTNDHVAWVSSSDFDHFEHGIHTHEGHVERTGALLRWAKGSGRGTGKARFIWGFAALYLVGALGGLTLVLLSVFG